MAYAVDPHPAFFDLPGRETHECRRDTEVDLHEDVAIAPLVAGLHGVGALAAIPALRAALARLERDRPDRVDGIELARLLLSWSTRWPDAAWDVSGKALDAVRERGAGGVDVARTFAPRYAENPLDLRGMREIASAETMSDAGGDARADDANAVTGATLQRDAFVATGSPGARARRRRDDRALSLEERNRKRDRMLQEDGLGRPALVGARVSREVHELFEDRGARAGASAGEVLEFVGRALLHGMTIAQLRDRLSAPDERT
jgi:hypothetical protein